VLTSIKVESNLPDNKAAVSLSKSGSVSKVEMTTPRALIYKMLFPSISTFETPPTRPVVVPVVVYGTQVRWRYWGQTGTRRCFTVVALL
jgi:hypothetical protein